MAHRRALARKCIQNFDKLATSNDDDKFAAMKTCFPASVESFVERPVLFCLVERRPHRTEFRRKLQEKA